MRNTAAVLAPVLAPVFVILLAACGTREDDKPTRDGIEVGVMGVDIADGTPVFSRPGDEHTVTNVVSLSADAYCRDTSSNYLGIELIDEARPVSANRAQMELDDNVVPLVFVHEDSATITSGNSTTLMECEDAVVSY